MWSFLMPVLGGLRAVLAGIGLGEVLSFLRPESENSGSATREELKDAFLLLLAFPAIYGLFKLLAVMRDPRKRKKIFKF